MANEGVKSNGRQLSQRRPRRTPLINMIRYQGDAHRAQLEDFIDAIREDRDPLITPESARKSVATILAIYESARTGKIVKV